MRSIFRGLRREPAFFALVIGILALGIASSVSVFSLADAILLRPLPYRAPDRLVVLEAVARKPPFDSNGSLSYADFTRILASKRSFEDVAAIYRSGWSRVTLTGGDAPASVQGAFTTPNLFSMIGRSPIAGRVFTAEENEHREHVAVLREGLAVSQFGSPAQAVCADIEISGVKWRVIGVMPEDFRVPYDRTQMWTPLQSHPEWDNAAEPDGRQQQRWDVMARLRPGVSLRQAQAELDAIESGLRAARPDDHEDDVQLVPFRKFLTRGVGRAFTVLVGAVGFLLLIVCANVGNLLLARAIARSRDFSVRAALGAGRGGLVRHVVAEATLLSLIAGAIGAAVAPALLRVLVSFAPADTPRLYGVSSDARLLLLALLLSAVIGLALGLVCAWRTVPRDTLAISRRGATEGREHRRLRSVLVASEFALAMILLTGATLFVRSFVAVLNVDPGFRSAQVLTANMTLPGATAAQATQTYRQLLPRIAALPGVQAVGGISSVFFLDTKRNHALRQVEGRAPEPVTAWKPLVWAQVNGGYFQAMGIPLVSGRCFNDGDRADAPPVAIVNQTLARRYWPGEDAVGKHLKGFDPRGKHDDWLTVVGVVKDTRSGGLERAPLGQIYEVQEQRGEQIGTLIVRTSGDPVQLAGAVRTAIREANPAAVISSISTMDRILDAQLRQRRFQTWLIGVFSAIALGLAALGVFGVMHYAVAAKTPEIGIRIAVGAQRADVFRLILVDGVKLTAAGIAVGALAAAWTSHAIAGMLYGVTPGDPLSMTVAAAALMVVALAACSLPARRATRVDPLVALRDE